ncbi:MAG: type II methionyl aminopeptidase [Candidatus Diapherotrites archaeon]|nr:type II methionyl aminopeptidase [Candidatus Diapherotrites archaeon]
MKEEEVENYIKAGKILQKIIKYAKEFIRPEQTLLEIATKIEEKIAKEKASPAFPVNLSLNNEAAHRTPAKDDAKKFTKKDIMKVDIGVHIDGYIADAAFSISYNKEHNELIKASKEALRNTEKILKEGITLGEIGKTIEETIRAFGFKPIANLSGHGLAQYEAHAEPTIPNTSNKSTLEIKDIAFAIEPFASTGNGYVRDSHEVQIYSIDEIKPVRSKHARNLLNFIMERFKTLPFAERWLYCEELKLNEFQTKLALRELIMHGCLKEYPILKDIEGSLVSQAEASFLAFNGEIIRIV